MNFNEQLREAFESSDELMAKREAEISKSIEELVDKNTSPILVILEGRLLKLAQAGISKATFGISPKKNSIFVFVEQGTRSINCFGELNGWEIPIGDSFMNKSKSLLTPSIRFDSWYERVCKCLMKVLCDKLKQEGVDAKVENRIDYSKTQTFRLSTVFLEVNIK